MQTFIIEFFDGIIVEVKADSEIEALAEVAEQDPEWDELEYARNRYLPRGISKISRGGREGDGSRRQDTEAGPENT